MKMRRTILSLLLAACAAGAQAHGELSALSALSALPVASVVGTASAAAGAVAVLPVALSTAGVLLSAAGEVLAFLPNALGEALLYNERLTR